MAQTKKDAKKSNKKEEQKKTKKKNVVEGQQEFEKNGMSDRVKAILLCALAVLLFAIMIVPGAKAWNAAHDFMYGVFGVCGFGVIALMIVIAHRYETGKKGKHFVARSWCIVFTIILLESFIHVIYVMIAGTEGFGEGIKVAFNGFWQGVIGAVVGGFFVTFIGEIGSLILLIVIIAALIFIFTGLTISDASRAIKKPISKIKSKKLLDIPEYDDEIEPVVEEKTAKKKKQIDFPIDFPEEKKTKDEVKNESKDEGDTSGVDAPIYYFDDSKEKKGDREPEVIESVDDDEQDDATDKEKEAMYHYPPLNLLKESKSNNSGDIVAELKQNGEKLVETLESFGVSTKIAAITRGPAVTRYELQPAAGVKISQITHLADDIAMNLAASGVRIEAPIPNKSAVGIEIPNKNVNVVDIKELIDCNDFKGAKSKLTVALGRDIEGNPICADLAKMPHVLIAGATGSGKSVCINSMIISLLYKSTPGEVKFIMIDPKTVELSNYNGIPHLLVPVVTEPSKASGALKWAVQEMERRYRSFAEMGVRDLASYNNRCDVNEEMEKMPQIVIIIDELADLMMVARNEVEDSICRLAQKARAAGMHLVLATQRPSVNVITGVIKANIPSRVAFAVSSQVDSRTILDMSGAEKLLGKGDMLFAPIGMPKPKRVQGCFVSDDEIEAVVEFVKSESNAQYSEEINSEIDRLSETEKSGGKRGDVDAPSDKDVLYDQAAELVIRNTDASTTFLQRKLNIGYARAARIMDQLCESGIIGPSQGSKPRDVLITMDEWLEIKAMRFDD
ncbi:MAG: DNA translocase FtsK 4TM domain-containing protein [Clostridia bacterium]|nr:DNA translocase FtsK 4TM domain-containing protein [Clostridia bacterium]